MKNSKILIFFLLFFAFSSYAQKQKLEKQKLENIRKIKNAEKILRNTRSKKNASLGELKALNESIRVRRSLIQSIKHQLNRTNTDLNDLIIITKSLETDLKRLNREYSNLVYNTYKTNQGYNKLIFLFSSSDFYQFFRRLEYLKQYSKARKSQMNHISKVREEFTQQKKEVVKKKETHTSLLKEHLEEEKKIKKHQVQQSNLLTQLSKKETQLKKEVTKRKKTVANLKKLIAKIIEEETKRSRASQIATITGEKELGRLFESYRGKLKWPTSIGFLSSKFGRQQHPVLKRIIVVNDGISIQTPENAPARAVFDGVVSTIANIENMRNIVIVKHGKYYTVYGRLKTVSVKKGQKIKANDLIGTVYTNFEGVSELEFQLWREKEKLDPEKWLTRK